MLSKTLNGLIAVVLFGENVAFFLPPMGLYLIAFFLLISYKQTDGMKSMVPIYQYLVDGGFGLKILVFSGDDDGVCATIGTQSWIWDMGYTVAGRAWQPYVVSQQTAGFLTKWSNTKLAFLTVHGAGHEVRIILDVDSILKEIL